MKCSVSRSVSFCFAEAMARGCAPLDAGVDFVVASCTMRCDATRCLPAHVFTPGSAGADWPRAALAECSAALAVTPRSAGAGGCEMRSRTRGGWASSADIADKPL